VANTGGPSAGKNRAATADKKKTSLKQRLDTKISRSKKGVPSAKGASPKGTKGEKKEGATPTVPLEKKEAVCGRNLRGRKWQGKTHPRGPAQRSGENSAAERLKRDHKGKKKGVNPEGGGKFIDLKNAKREGKGGLRRQESSAELKEKRNRKKKRGARSHIDQKHP